MGGSSGVPQCQTIVVSGRDGVRAGAVRSAGGMRSAPALMLTGSTSQGSIRELSSGGCASAPTHDPSATMSTPRPTMSRRPCPPPNRAADQPVRSEAKRNPCHEEELRPGHRSRARLPLPGQEADRPPGSAAAAARTTSVGPRRSEGHSGLRRPAERGRRCRRRFDRMRCRCTVRTLAKSRSATAIPPRYCSARSRR